MSSGFSGRPGDGERYWARPELQESLAKCLGSVDERGSALTIIGRAGMGTTSLLRLAGEDARGRGFTVLQINALPPEIAAPFTALNQLGELAQRSLTGDWLPRQLAAMSYSARVDELAATIARLAQTRSVLVVIDDAHLLDEVSRRALAVLSRQLTAAPVVLLVGMHADYQGPDGFTEIRLRPLTDSEAERLADERGGLLHPGLRRRIVAESCGNPMAISELAARRRSPESLEDEVLSRFLPVTDRLRACLARDLDLSPLSDAAAAVLVAAVYVGDEVVQVVEATGLLLGYPVDIAVLDEAIGAGLITIAGGRVHFASALTRSAIISGAKPLAVRAANTALETALAAQPHHRVWHAAHASDGPNERLARQLEASIGEAERRGELADALRRWEKAARLSPKPDDGARRLVMAGRAAFELGRPETGEQLVAAAECIGLSELQQGAVDALRARFAARLTRHVKPIHKRCRLILELDRSGQTDAALDVLIGVAQSLLWADPDSAAREQVVMCLRGMVHADQDLRYITALACASPESAREQLAALEIQERDPDTCRMLAIAAATTGDLARAADLFSMAAKTLRSAGRFGVLTHVQGLHAQVTMQLGDWEVAWSAAQECLALAQETKQPLWELRAMATRATLGALRSDTQEAMSDVRAVERMVNGHRLGSLLASTRLARGLALLSDEDWTAAYDTFRSLFERSDPAYDSQSLNNAVGYLAEAALQCGRVKETSGLLESLEQAQSASGVPLVLGLHLGYAHALLAADSCAEALFVQALATTPVHWPWLRARLELAYGAWLRRQRRILECRAPLQGALQTFELLGAQTWATRARTELRASGVRGGPCAVEAGPLSPQEWRIAELASEGLTNRQIGQRLFLSPRTIGSHLYRIFPKLDVTSRSQLGARLPVA